MARRGRGTRPPWPPRSPAALCEVSTRVGESNLGTRDTIRGHVAYPFSGPPTSWLKGGARRSSIPRSRRQCAARRRSLGGSIEHPGLYAPVKERALENIFLKKYRDRGRRSRYFLTAAKTFWLAARRATGALEVVKVVPKVSPGALRPNRTIFTVSRCPRGLGVLADCQLVPATGRSSKGQDPGLQAHPIRACLGPHLRMQMSPYQRTCQSAPVGCV